MWFDRWYDLVRVAAVGPLAYVALVAFLRVSGKRTLAKLNAFDYVVTVALGSTLATVLLSSDVSFAEGLAGLGLLVAAQFVVAATTTRLPFMRTLVNSKPQLVLRRGEVLHDVLVRERLSVAEVHQALRQQGLADLEGVAAVVLETDGSLSVVPDAGSAAITLADVEGWSARPAG